MHSQKMLVKLKKASTESQKGNYLKSISLCKKILDKEPSNVTSLKLLATNLIKLNRFSEVEIALKKAIKLVTEEESYPLLHLLGCNYISLNNYSVALNVLEELFNRTGDSKVLLDIALSYAKLYEYEVSSRCLF
ncbi:tetratricopeptide repeat protein [Psychromonas sp. KJ10-10]|uniref:tetratricopeptide repeat protein n=1 Tax=Psychromonas sp. KJ10-10 TaxID=3391823 RepID=UPI0039B551FE